jgi:hypothetical protein
VAGVYSVFLFEYCVYLTLDKLYEYELRCKSKVCVDWSADAVHRSLASGGGNLPNSIY